MVRLSRKQTQQATRERLRKSALRTFGRNGVTGTDIEAIVRGAGYTRGAFYANYRSKPELLIEILEEKQTIEVRLWNKMITDAINVDDCLTLVVD